MKNQRTTSKCTLIFSFIRYIHSHISSKVTSKLLKLSQLKRMIRVYINYGVKINDYRLC